MDNNVDIFKIVKDEFCSLWSFKERGNSLEIITPFSTTNSKLISVFLTKRGDDFIITDGGWIMNGEYGVKVDLEDEIFLRIYDHYTHYYNVKTITNKATKYYYKSISSLQLIPSLVYDMGHFMMAIISTSQIQFYDEKEKNERETFKSDANSFLTSFLHKDKVIFNKELSKDYNVKFNAIVADGGKIKLVKYVTGSTVSYFSNSLTKATVDFEIANGSPFNDVIIERVALINDAAQGFVEGSLFRYIYALQDHTMRDVVRWSQRDNLIKILQ
ncbi:hypothetical protein [Pedobacter panaciterrae]